MFIVVIVLGAILALAFAGAGGSKLAGVPPMRQAATHLGYSFSIFRWIGFAEVLGSAGIVVGLWHIGFAGVNLAVLAAACLVVLMVGAVAAHLRAGDPAPQWIPSASLAALTLVFAGLRIVTG